MSLLRLVSSLLVVLASVVGSLGAAPLPPASSPVDPVLLATRDAAWRAYFAGDTKALDAMLPDEFLGLGMTDEPFKQKAETLADAAAFRANGGRLVRLEFPETRAQRFGDVTVLYGRFELVIATGAQERTFRGRLTEIFVWRGGRWLHPGWHLDVPPSASQPQ